MRFGKFAAFLAAFLLIAWDASAETEDLVRAIEGQLPWYEFAPMPEEVLQETKDALGDIADAYEFTGRASEDGAYGYILGVLVAEKSPLEGLYVERNYRSGDVELWRDGVKSWMRDEKPVYTLRGMTIGFPEGASLLFVQPDDYLTEPWSLWRYEYAPVYQAIMHADETRLEEMTARGVYLCKPPAPYLSVFLLGMDGFRTEYIWLTEEDLERAEEATSFFSRERVGALTVVMTEEQENRWPIQRIPAPFVELAQERCGFVIDSPEDIGEIASARLTVRDLPKDFTQTVDDPEALFELVEILRGARPYGEIHAVIFSELVLTMADGSEKSILIAREGFPMLLFGSSAPYDLYPEAEERFWEIFVDAHAHF